MLSLWLLLPLLFTLARAFLNPRHSGGQPTEGSPSCDELRAFWEDYHRVSQISQETNEIPILPMQIYEHVMPGSGRIKHHVKPIMQSSKGTFSNRFVAANSFNQQPWNTQKPIQSNSYFLPLQPKTPSDQDMNGIFGEFHEPSLVEMPLAPNHQQTDFQERSAVEMLLTPNHHRTEPEMFGFGSSSAMSPLLSAKKNGESEFYIPQWGLPDEVDSFGSFVDFDIPHMTMTRTHKDSTGGQSDLSQLLTSQESSQVACNVVMNSQCTKSEQCACKGSKKLACIRGKCLYEDMNSDIAEQYGTWHDGPVPESQLRLLSRLRKRSNRSTFM